MRHQILVSMQVMAAAFILGATGSSLVPLAPRFSFSVFLILWAGAIAFVPVRWLTRESRLGAVLLDITSVRPRLVLVGRLLAVGMFLEVLTNLYAYYLGDEQIRIFRMGLDCLFSFYFWNFLRGEVCERGLALPGVFTVPWTRVRSYSWDPWPRENEVLSLSVSSFVTLWGLLAVPIHVRPKDRPKVDAILEQQLFEWPE